MALLKMCREEDLFPRLFAQMITRPWGCLFLSPHNPDSYDGNHALLHRVPEQALPDILQEITRFYRMHHRRAIIYQSAMDNGWFGEIGSVLAAHGFACWQEEQTWMRLTHPSLILPEDTIGVEETSVWQDDLGRHIFEAADEPWEIAVARAMLDQPGTICLTARMDGRPVGMVYGHINGDDICRMDYLLVAKAYRGRGVGRALTHAFVQRVKARGTECYLWPDGQTPRRIYREAGFREWVTMRAGRAAAAQD